MWNERYSLPGFAYGTTPNDFLVEVADRLPKGRVLALCDGEGRNGVYLAERGHDVVALDGSAVGLKKAEALAAERGTTIETIAADLNDYHIAPNAYDAVVAIFAHLPQPLRERVHREAVASLKPGGVFVLEAYTPRQVGRGTGGPRALPMLMDVPILERELAGLDFEILREVEREIHEGAYHTGDSATVQVLGVKR
ncbi:MAG: class I SAM-dependent methyltransferase [Bacteroidota bacterium]